MEIFSRWRTYDPCYTGLSGVPGRLLIVHGITGRSAIVASFAALAVDLEKAGSPHEMLRYGSAPHFFSIFGGHR
jgi:hypothetical protein